MAERIDLVIFDCDGVLVDSERLAISIEAKLISSLGWPLSELDIIDRFVGRSDAYMQGEIERHIGRAVDWETEFAPRCRAVFEQELTPVDGVIEALDAITLATCVASSGTHEKLRFTLGLTGLYDRFAGRIFSASDVANGKPAPDLFLHAGNDPRLGVAVIGGVSSRGGEPRRRRATIRQNRNPTAGPLGRNVGEGAR